jgi:tetratricopeptide (TPR) repeat protein
MIAAEHRNYSKAVEVIERAIALAPRKAEYFAHRGRCLLALQRPREAFEAAQQALALAPSDALTLDTIGVVMTRAGAHADAVEPFRRAVARDASKPAYHYNLGAALQFVGELTAAAEEYRRALELDPSFHRAWSSLAQVARAPLTSSSARSSNRTSMPTWSFISATRSRNSTKTKADTQLRFACSSKANAARLPRSATASRRIASSSPRPQGCRHP